MSQVPDWTVGPPKRRGKLMLFDLAERLNGDERERLGLPRVNLRYSESVRDENAGTIRCPQAVMTEEFRAPRKGEWYLSGAVPLAWRAPNDYDAKSMYRIMRIGLFEYKTTTAVREVTP